MLPVRLWCNNVDFEAPGGPIFTLFCWNPKAADTGVITPAAPEDAGAEILEEVQDNPLADKEEPVEVDADAAIAVEVGTAASKVREHSLLVKLNNKARD